MKTIFIVTLDDLFNKEALGAFSTEELAEDCIKMHKIADEAYASRDPYMDNSLKILRKSYIYEIKELEIDVLPKFN